MQYFYDNDWEPEWIDHADCILKTNYDKFYKATTTVQDDKTQDSITTSTQATAGKKSNKFDNLFKFLKPKADPHDELDRYLAADIEACEDPLVWWTARRKTYPRLSRIALDYLTIPATSVKVEHTFSKGQLLLSHIRNRLSAQSTRAILCVGDWSKLGFIEDSDIDKVVLLEDIEDGKEEEMPDGWDHICE